tara:strand:+ start:162 stop:731 length:570 start_codon:yes stop_codon:yes gene_type:complete
MSTNVANFGELYSKQLNTLTVGTKKLTGGQNLVLSSIANVVVDAQYLIAPNLVVSGDTTLSNLTVDGVLTAAGLAFTDLSVTNVTATGLATLATANITTLNLAGSLEIPDDLIVNGNLRVNNLIHNNVIDTEVQLMTTEAITFANTASGGHCWGFRLEGNSLVLYSNTTSVNFIESDAKFTFAPEPDAV